MSIAVVIDSLDVGGAQRLLEIQARAMRASRHTLRVINLSGRAGISQTLRAMGVEVVDLEQRRLLDWTSWRKAAKLVRAWRPDLVHAHLTHSAIMAPFLARTAGARLVVTLHSEVPEPGGLVKGVLERLVLTYMADHIIACGARVARAQRQRVGRTPMSTVVNRVEPPVPLQPAECSAIRSSLGYTPDDVVVLSAGRLSPEKGFDVLIKAFAPVAARHPEARLLIVGEGKERPGLSSLIDQAGLTGSVRLQGQRSDIQQLMAAADMYVLPSRWEGLPLVLLEAMVARLPIVASRVGDVAAVVGADAAVLVEPEDGEALTAAILELVGDPKRRRTLAEKAQRAAEPYANLSGFAAELEAVYAAAMADRCRLRDRGAV